MANAQPDLRPLLVEIMLGMGEITDEQAAGLIAAPDSDLDLARMNFNSLTMLDFCLKIETNMGIVFEPDELVELETLSALEAALKAKRQT
jgi:acyl carrier protein